MNDRSPHVETLLGTYRDLDDATRCRVEAHLATCATCAARLAEFESVDHALSGLASPVPDSAAVEVWRTAMVARTARQDEQPGAVAASPRRGGKEDARFHQQSDHNPRRRPGLALVATAALVLGLIVLVAGGVSGRLGLGDAVVRWGRGALPSEPATATPLATAVGATSPAGPAPPAGPATPADGAEGVAHATPGAADSAPPAATPEVAAAPADEAALSVTGNGDVFSVQGTLPFAVSADGRVVAFASRASNLVPGDTNQCSSQWAGDKKRLGSCTDVFVRDIETGRTWRASVSKDGIETGTAGTSMSRAGGDELDGESFAPALTPDGRYLAFRSRADILMNGKFSDACAKRTSEGVCDGIYFQDLSTGEVELLYVLGDGGYADSSYAVEISADGRHVLFDSGGESDPIPGVPTPAARAGASGMGSAVLLYDRQTRAVRYAEPDDRRALGIDVVEGEVSADGRYRVFASHDATLVPGDTRECERPGGETAQYRFPANCSDVFLTDQVTGVTERISLAPDGGEPDGDSRAPTISADGRTIAFESNAANLLPDELRGLPQPCGFGDAPDACPQVFLFDRQTRALSLITRGEDGLGNGPSRTPRISADGRRVVFWSVADNLVEGDRNEAMDLFVYDRASDHVEAVSVAGPRPHAVYFARTPSAGKNAVLTPETLRQRFIELGYNYTEAHAWPEVLAADAAQRIDVLVLDPGSLAEVDGAWVSDQAAAGGIALGGINVHEGDLQRLVGDSASALSELAPGEFHSVVGKVRTENGEWGTMSEAPVFDADQIKAAYGDSLEKVGIHWEPWHPFFRTIGAAVGRIYAAEVDGEPGAE